MFHKKDFLRPRDIQIYDCTDADTVCAVRIKDPLEGVSTHELYSFQAGHTRCNSTLTRRYHYRQAVHRQLTGTIQLITGRHSSQTTKATSGLASKARRTGANVPINYHSQEVHWPSPPITIAIRQSVRPSVRSTMDSMAQPR